MRVAWGSLLLLIVLSAAGLAAGQGDVNFEDDEAGNEPITCPTPISKYADLYKAMACKGDGCADIACDTVRLDSYAEFAYGPPKGGVTLPVLRNITVLGADDVIWSTGREDEENPEKAVRVHEGITLSLKDITVETDPIVSSTLFLLPKVFRMVGDDSRLNLENVTYLTSRAIWEDVITFAKGNLPGGAYKETRVPSGEDAIVISDYTSQVMTVKDLTISHWTFPIHDREEEGHRGQGIVNNVGLVNAMKTWNTFTSTDQLEIQEDVSLEKSNFDDDFGVQQQAKINRRLAVFGQRSTFGPFEKVPLLDLGLVKEALKVKEGVPVEFRDLELLNLALGPLDKHYGFLMWFLDFDRNSNFTTVTISNSTMVVSCRELEHFEYAVALLNDPLQTLLPQLPFLKLNSMDWTIDSDSNGVIRVRQGLAFGLELHDVNLTCTPTHGDLRDVDFQLMSPLATTSSDPVPSPPQRELPPAAPNNSLGTSSTLFKVGLGVLVPCIAVLAALLVWKCRSNMRIRSGVGGRPKTESDAKLKQYDVEAGKDTTHSLRDKNMKHSMSDSFEHDKLDQLPAMSHDGMSLGTDTIKLTPADVGGSQAAEFIPDILKVSNDIDDKQLVVKELLGQGQNGSVQKGVWRELEVAVKTIVFRGEGDKDFHQQAIREVAITSGLAHPNVVCTYSYDIKRLQPGSLEARVAGLKNNTGVNILDSYVDWKLFIIQEYCEQGTLQVALRDKIFTDSRTEMPDLKCLLEIATGIAKGMHHIHSKNILHGNLKPSNVLLKTALDTHTKMMAKIADFGLSLKMNSEQTHVSNVQQGEPFYMAREVMEEGSASKAADVYAFGVVLWEMYTSQLAPKGEPTKEMFSQFPRLPWQCPAMYGVLAVACMHPVPSGRPTFSDCLIFLQSLWHQQRMGTLTPLPPVSSAALREKFRDCKDIMGGCPKVHCGGMDNHQPMTGRVPLNQMDPEYDRAMDKRLAYFEKSLDKMPPVFRNIDYEAVYWPEVERSPSTRWMHSE